MYELNKKKSCSKREDFLFVELYRLDWPDDDDCRNQNNKIIIL